MNSSKKETSASELLRIQHLRTYYRTYLGLVKAVDDIDLRIDTGRIFGLVGESGCGKSTVALSIIRLIPDPPIGITQGEIIFDREDLVKKSEKEMQRIRGRRISMIFQEPLTSLNPVIAVGEQVRETIIIHAHVGVKESKKRTLEMLRRVRIADPERVYNQYPHELSGGMKQRVMIAIALSCNPALLVADEPTTSLDVTIGAQILQLLRQLVKEMGTSVLLITHDFGVVAAICDIVGVMYAGKMVEVASVRELFRQPRHPYTERLLRSIPASHLAERGKKQPLRVISGSVPNLISPPQGCRFHPRCELAEARCSSQEPKLCEWEPGHSVACLVVNDRKGSGANQWRT